VWDYPRPPRLEPTTKHVLVVFGGETIADSHRAIRVLETSHAPVYYIPPEDVRMDYLTPTTHRTVCEWKGTAVYYTVAVGHRAAEQAAWTYPNPTGDFAAIAGYVAFYPARMDDCFLDGERVEAQPGGFYGGWITRDIVGPFKGGAGTAGW
jgi:uncharacterized protein (DUF427 family)